MAKHMVAKGKKQFVQPIAPDMTGTLDGQEVTRKHNPKTNRYDLRVDGELNVSCLNSDTCIRRAADKGVVWET